MSNADLVEEGSSETTGKPSWGSRVILMIAQGTAKGGTYGFRSIITLYMVQALGVPKNEAYSIFWMFATAIAAFPILGGFLGDRFRKPVLVTQIGATLSLIGTLVITLEGLFPFYVALTLFAIGAGLFDPNVKALFGRSIKQEERNMDGGWTLFFLFLNFFALTTPALPSFLGTEDAFRVSFAVMGLFPLISLGLMSLYQYRKDHKALIPLISQKGVLGSETWKRAGFFFFLLLTFIGAWTFYEWAMGRITYSPSIEDQINSLFDQENALLFLRESLPSSMTMIFHILLVGIWFLWKTSTLKKLGVGFLIFAFSASFLVPALMDPGELGAERTVRYFLIFLTLNAVFETLTTPSFYSIITRGIPERWLGTAFGAFSMLTIPVSSLITESITSAGYAGVGTNYSFFFLFLLFAGLFFAIDRWWKPFAGSESH